MIMTTRYKKDCNYVGVLSQILKNFDSAIWTEQTMELVDLVKDSDASDYAAPIHAFTSLCLGLCKSPPPAKQKLPFLNKAWKAVKAEKDLRTCVVLYSAAFMHARIHTERTSTKQQQQQQTTIKMLLLLLLLLLLLAGVVVVVRGVIISGCCCCCCWWWWWFSAHHNSVAHARGTHARPGTCAPPPSSWSC